MLYFYPPEYVQAIESICRQYNILLAFDEMQSGFARTGLAFGYQHYQVQPDLIACGKGMGGVHPCLVYLVVPTLWIFLMSVI